MPQALESLSLANLAKVLTSSREPLLCPILWLTGLDDCPRRGWLGHGRSLALACRDDTDDAKHADLIAALKPLALKGDSRLYAAMKAYRSSENLDDLWGTLDILQALPPARKV